VLWYLHAPSDKQERGRQAKDEILGLWIKSAFADELSDFNKALRDY
jgi:hypothetical protein